MKVISILILSIIVLLAITLKETEAKWVLSPQLWNKYRVNIIKMLQPRFKSKANGVNIHHTILSIVTTPDQAKWHNDKSNLQDYFASHPVTWGSRFSYVTRTADNKISALYKKGILACKNKTAFLVFMKAKVDHIKGRVSYPWVEVGETLKSFINRAQKAKTDRIHFVVRERAGSMNINSPWGRSTRPLNKAGPFVRKLTPTLYKKIYSKSDNVFANSDVEEEEDILSFDESAEAAVVDEEEAADEDDGEDAEDDEEEEVHIKEQSESSWLFRRRSRRPPPKPTTITIKSEKFYMDFKAKDLTGITINPGQWFDKKVIRASKKCMANLINHGKPMSLIPKIAWVAYKPRIVLKLSQTEWQKVQRYWSDPNVMGMTIGGSLFRNRHYRGKVRSDDEMWNSLSEEEREILSDDSLAELHSDTAEFKEEMVERDTTEEERATFRAETHATIVHDINQDDENDDEEEEIVDNQTLSASTWFFRRRRRRAPPPPPPPRKVYEKVYTASFQSNSPFPEIIAVTSERVANM